MVRFVANHVMFQTKFDASIESWVAKLDFVTHACLLVIRTNSAKIIQTPFSIANPQFEITLCIDLLNWLKNYKKFHYKAFRVQGKYKMESHDKLSVQNINFLKDIFLYAQPCHSFASSFGVTSKQP